MVIHEVRPQSKVLFRALYLNCAAVLLSCVQVPPTVPLPGPPTLSSIAIDLNGAASSGQCVHQFPYMQLQVVGKADDGTPVHSTTYFTDGRPEFKKGTIAEQSLEISVTQGQISPNLFYIPPVNDFDLLGRSIEFTARARSNPAVTATLSWLPGFDCHSVVALRGRDGVNGAPGGNGGHGEDGPDVDVILTYLHLDRPQEDQLALAKVMNSHSGALLGYYIFSPKHGIRFDVSGGYGGAGGSPYVVDSVLGGGRTGGGGLYDQGPTTSQTTMPGGVAGQSGRSGNVHLSVDERFPALARSVQVTRGSGGTPESNLPLTPRLVPPASAFKDEFLVGLPVEPLAQLPEPTGQELVPDAGVPVAE